MLSLYEQDRLKHNNYEGLVKVSLLNHDIFNTKRFNLILNRLG